MGYNTLKLCGAQVCDYLYVQSTPVGTTNFLSVDSEPSQWGSSTLLLSKFDENLVGGNSALVGNLSGYKLMRKKGDENSIKYVATLDEKFSGRYIVDYMVANDSAYTYYIYPFGNTSASGVVLSPFVTKEVTPKWDYWSLLVVDETDEENVFYLNKMFKFELNLATDDMNNNAVCSITQNFTQYPTIQYGTANYWSSALTSLCGFISCGNCDYVQTPDIVAEFKELSTDGRRKFLKDMDGNVWEVKVTAPINISTDDATLARVKSVKVSWTEVGNASDVSVINNPALSTNSWVLTKTGYAAPYTNYIWDDDEFWNDKKIWTETYSAGRDIEMPSSS